MGDCKDNMTPKDSKSKNLFDKFKGRGRKSKTTEDKAENFADQIASSHESLEKLIITKEADLKNEKGQEKSNGIKLAKLRTMAFHLEEIVEVASSYD